MTHLCGYRLQVIYFSCMRVRNMTDGLYQMSPYTLVMSPPLIYPIIPQSHK